MANPAGARHPRRPETSILYTVVADQLETFLARQQQRERPLPGFVEYEFRSYLQCGVLEYGFLRLHCDRCRKDRLLAFSCKNRGFCPSCGGRRMAGAAAHLVDRVIPDVPVRQWVLSLPYALRYRLAFDAQLLSEVLGVFVRAVFGWLKRQARDCGVPRAHCGAVTFIQRFGSALNLTPHFHMLAFDGVYAAQDGERPQFYPLRSPAQSDVAEVAERVAGQTAALLDSRDVGGRSVEDEMGAIYSASIAGRVATGEHAGQKVRTRGTLTDDEGAEEHFQTGRSRNAMTSGFSVHAGVAIRAGDRKTLERLCRYASRPPLALERLAELPDGRLSYRLKTPWRNGTTHVIFERLDFMGKLAALIPYPRPNLIRYHGVLAPAAKWRASIVPASTVTAAAPVECGCEHGETGTTLRHNYAWAALMARVFEVDVLVCEYCGGKLRIAAIHPPDATRKILDCLDLPTRAPPLKPALH
jgi:hypothetical protein